MRIKLNTIMAHPKHGVAHPGQIIDLPEKDARPLLDGGHADPIGQQMKPAATLFQDEAKTAGPETAMLEGAEENETQPRGRARK